MTTQLKCAPQIIETTLRHLREGGERDIETVVLWLGHATAEVTQITEAYRPDQEAAFDRFHISSEAMRAVMAHLRKTRAKIVAQVHSHPREAFHSAADDEWAIVRHAGAHSLVVPNFAEDTTLNNFFDQVAAYELSSDDRWMHIELRTALKLEEP